MGMDLVLSRDFKSNIHSKGRGPCVSSGDNVDNESVKSNALPDRYKWVMGAFWIMCWWWAINHRAIPTPSAEGGLRCFTGNPQVGRHINMKNNESANFEQWFALDKHSENLSRLVKRSDRFVCHMNNTSFIVLEQLTVPYQWQQVRDELCTRKTSILLGCDFINIIIIC